MSTSDLALLHQWHTRRNARAFHELAVRHTPMVYATCRRVLRNDSSAEDVTQECFELLATAKRPPKTQLPAWLHRVATNRSLDKLRSAGSRAQREREYAELQKGHGEIEWDDLYTHIDEIIDELTDHTRHAIVATFLENRSQTAVAGELGVTPQAVNKRIARGIETIRTQLRKRGIEVTATALSTLMTEKIVEAAVPPALASSVGKIALVSSSRLATAGGKLAGVFTSGKLLVAAMVIAIVLASSLLLNRETESIALIETTEIAEVAGPAPAVEDDLPEIEAQSGVRDNQVSEDEESDDNREAKEVAPLAEEVEAVQEKAPPEPVTVSVSGYVVDEEGLAISGAYVSLAPPDSQIEDKTSSSVEQKPMSHQSISNSRGFFSFSVAVSSISHIKLSASAPGYSSSKNTTLSANDDRTHYDALLTLTAGTILYGEIRDPNGRPVPSAVVISKAFDSENSSSFGAGPFAVTDSKGRFLLGFSQPGATTLEFRIGALGTTLIHDVPVGVDDIVVLRWPEGATLEGAVTGASQYDAGELVMVLQGRITIESFGGSSSGSGMTYMSPILEDGRYRIERISTAQRYKAHIRNADGDVLTSKIPLEAFEEGKTQVFDYFLEQTVTLTGVVRGAISGQPLRDIKVRWRSLDDPNLTDVVEIDDEGAYRFELRAPAGRYAVYPTFITHDLPEYQENYGRTITTEPGTDQSVHLTFLDPVTRTVLVVNNFGEPIEGVQVLYNEENHSWSMGWKTDETGRFTYHGVRPYVEAHLKVSSSPRESYWSVVTETFTAEPGDVFEEEVVVISSPED
jgi:RNA polymerase sigma-70 factor (ECF subfamily)